MPRRDSSKPKGALNSYAAFVQVCREEHKRKHPSDQIVFSEFSKKCSERWRKMNDKEKKRFAEIAAKDKARYQREMAGYVPSGEEKGGKRKRSKDPNAPKRALSAFFFFCGEFRAEVKAKHPSWSVGEIAKELGKRWEKVGDKSKYEKLAADDKIRYEKAMAAYSQGSPSKRGRHDAEVSDDSDADSD